MRGLVALIALLALAPAACKREAKPQVTSLRAGTAAASVVKMNDPDAAAQLLSGFYAVEENSWRWVGRKFSVALHPPRGAAQQGAFLRLKFNLPNGLVKQGPVTVSASVGSQALMPETYTEGGNYSYVRDIPASALGGDVVVNFTCDKALPPANGDIRELSLIAVSVGLEEK